MKSGKPGLYMRGKANCHVIGGIVQGASHIRQGKPCQDAIVLTELPDGTIIVAIADGHGSDSCPHSKCGAEIATEVASKLLTELVSRPTSDEALRLLNDNKNDRIPKQLEQKWKEAVKAHYEANFGPEPFSFLLYGSTLIAIAVTPEFTFALQIGDGDLLMVNEDGIVSQILPPEYTAVGEETESLCQSEAWKYVRSCILPQKRSETSPMFMVSTDGYAKGFANTAGFHKAAADFYRLLSEEGPEKIHDELEQWLRLSSDRGSGDDIALALIFTEEANDNTSKKIKRKRKRKEKHDGKMQ